MYICLYVCIHVDIYMFLFMYVCMYTYMYVCVYVYTPLYSKRINRKQLCEKRIIIIIIKQDKTYKNIKETSGKRERTKVREKIRKIKNKKRMEKREK